MAIQTDVSDSAMAAAIEANFLEAFEGFDVLPAFRLHGSAQMVWFDNLEVPYPLPNGVMRTRLEADSADSEIGRITRHFQTHHLPALWWLWPSAQPGDLTERLAAQGWMLTGSEPGMAADLQQLPAGMPAVANFEIVRVANDDMLRQWRRVMLMGFELPDPLAALFYEVSLRVGFDENAVWQNYVGLLDGQPVSCATVVFSAGVAGLFNVATLPEARGKGIGAAITHYALSQARTRGYRIAVLIATEMGYRIYQRLGFREYFKVGQYLYLPAD